MVSKTVLVTGGAGFIGSHVVDRLVRAGFEVVVVDNLATGKKTNVNPNAKFYPCDVRDSQLVETMFKTFKPAVVFHLAAQTSVVASVANPQDDALTNILGTIALLRLCSTYEIERIVYSSTGGALYGEPQRLPCDEEHPIHPLSPYGASKHAAEVYVHSFAVLGGFNYTILRYANVYGPRQDPEGEAGVVAIFTKRMLEGRELVIYGDGFQERDFVYVDDVVQANLLALSDKNNSVFNIGSGKATNINDLFGVLAKFTGYGGQPTYAPPRKGDVYRIYLDARRAREALGWEAEIGMEDGLKRTVEYFRSQQ